MTGNVLKEIEENIKDYEEQGIEQIPLSLVKYWISVLEKENEQLIKEAEVYNEDAMSYQTLYEQQLEGNKELKQQLEDCEFAHRTEMAHHRVVEKELKEKIAKRDYTSMGLYDD